MIRAALPPAAVGEGYPLPGWVRTSIHRDERTMSITTTLRPRHRRSRRLTAAAVGVALLLGSAACSDEEPAARASSEAGDPSTTVADGPRGEEASADGADDDAIDCENGPGRTVTDLPDVEVEAVSVDGVSTEDVTIDGVTVPGVTVEPVEIPGFTVDAGCIVEYEAPAGCLGRVEISGVEIPDVVIPAAEIPALSVAGLNESGDSAAEVRISGESVEPVIVEEVCRQVDGRDTVLPSVYRESAHRPTARRASATRASLRRSEACAEGTDSTTCVARVEVERVHVDAVRVDSVRVDSERIDSVRLDRAPDVPVLEGEDETAYVAPADVLFDLDSDELRPEADPVLAAIAEQIVDAGPDAEVRVEGHTDSSGSVEHNQDLSERRAQAVADWLVAEGDVPEDQLTVTGLGETAPIAPNDTADGEADDAGRQRNRRVVIGVTLP